MVWKITTEELLARYNTGERNFAGVEILRIVGEMGERDGVSGLITGLEGADLRGINLRGANLETVDVSGADLTGADLFGAYLGEAGLVKTILRNANLFSANLSSATLNGADLTGSDLTHVKAVGASFIRAKVPGFERGDLTHADFRDSTAGEYALCRWFNVIWHTTMPDGTIKEGPYCVW
ncbi:pentapeptide repeat-containing protein [Nodularia sphaerocarpa]|uniref:pentapeptide repeat-containing protein n=1 Tax=Nodularia sphaerocarpa TaxID=137816 RepID=UPI001EFB49B2|nr:pentapeptide repeat-containing protein [Nodularia sphaerocarpa]MDB9376089.1 pentapeptide repeat-containing protein [Nodularia sphaerocarpa CS-585]MDB9379404.1 pentapeptide repeat-containing protein [Nodularia sphaerocarpa CS-585A2]ULP72040.1 Secreted effector protein PipB2 [Nodularia sphaerocarpa UHCC 0038]